MAKSYRILGLLLACIACYHSALSKKQLSPFEKVTLEPAFIDKTDLIKTFIPTALQTNCYNVLITCPSRFGKSSNLDMIKRFIEYSDDEKVKTENRNLFKNPKLKLHVANEADFFSQHFAKYSLLFLNFSVEGNKATHEEVFGVVKNQIRQLFAQYSWLYIEPASPSSNKTKRIYPSAEHKKLFEKIQSDILNNSDYEKSLRILADDLSNYLDGDRDIVLLIDDYDAPIRFAMENQAKGSTIIPIIQALLTNALPKDNIVINFTMVVGTLVFDGFNDTTRNFNFLEEHKFLDYFGFTLKDIQVLSQADRFGFEVKENHKIQQYYNGYQTKTNKIRLFNPASVAAYCREEKFENFLPKTGYTINLVERLRSKYLRDKIQNLILNRVSPFKHEEALKSSHIDELEEILAKNDTRSAFKSNQVALYLSVLFQQGYLSYEYMDDGSPQELRCFRLPNEEVRLQLAEDLYKYFQKVVQGHQEKAKNVFTSFKNIMDGNFIEEELKKQTITALRDVMDSLYALGKYDYEQLTLDFHTFIYTSLVFDAEPEEKFDSVELAVVVDGVINGKLREDSGKIDLTVWNKDETVLLYIEMKTYPKFKTLQDALTHSKSFRPSGQLTKKPNYLKLLIIYLNISKKVEIGFGPTMEYGPTDGKWISNQKPLRDIPSESKSFRQKLREEYHLYDKSVYLEPFPKNEQNNDLFYRTQAHLKGRLIRSWLYELNAHMQTGNVVDTMKTLTKLFAETYSEKLRNATNKFSIMYGLLCKLDTVGISFRDCAKFKKNKTTYDKGGLVDIFTVKLKKNFIMSIKYGRSATIAMQQLIDYLKNYPITFLKTINNPKEAWFVGINFRKTGNLLAGMLDEWVAIPFNGTALFYNQCTASSEEYCSTLIKQNNA